MEEIIYKSKCTFNPKTNEQIRTKIIDVYIISIKI